MLFVIVSELECVFDYNRLTFFTYGGPILHQSSGRVPTSYPRLWNVTSEQCCVAMQDLALKSDQPRN
jgi:hypothetical protein